MTFFFFSSRRRHTRLQGDWSSDVCSSDLRHLGALRGVTYLCVPMMGQGEALGVLHVHSGTVSGEGDNRLTDAQQRLAVTAARHIALALANLRLRETLRMQSIRDPLTGLFNRRYMEESLVRELRRAGRSQRPLGGHMAEPGQIQS